MESGGRESSLTIRAWCFEGTSGGREPATTPGLRACACGEIGPAPLRRKKTSSRRRGGKKGLSALRLESFKKALRGDQGSGRQWRSSRWSTSSYWGEKEKDLIRGEGREICRQSGERIGGLPADRGWRSSDAVADWGVYRFWESIVWGMGEGKK